LLLWVNSMKKRKGISTNNMIIAAVVIIIVLVGGWYLTRPPKEPEPEPEDNIAPSAAAYLSKWAGDVGEMIEIDASGSRDPDGEIVKYTWDFGDGNIEDSTDEIISHSYDNPGNYIVLLTVEDDGGLTDTTEKRLTYIIVRHPEAEQSEETAPTAILAVDKDIIKEEEQVGFDASSSWGWTASEEGYAASTAKITSWLVDFGDGEQSDSSTVNHTYSSPGQYVTQLTVTDVNGLAGVVKRTIHVLNPEVEYEGEVKNPDTLTIAHVGFPHSLDPAEAHASPQPGESLDNMYDKLVWFKENLKQVEPWLAESWDISEDGLDYTFHLREGVMFHDGTELTAEDVEYSFERQMVIYIPEGHISMLLGAIMGTTAADGYNMEDIRNSIEVVDDYTVVIHLAKPFAPFMKLLTDYDFCIVNKDLVIANGGWDPETMSTDEDRAEWLGKKNPWISQNDAGSGAYQLVEYVPGQRLVFEAFEDYWQGEAPIKRVVVLFITELSTRLMMLKNGDADVAAIPVSYRAQVEGQEGIAVYAGMPSNTADFITINFNISAGWMPPETAWLGETGTNVRPDLFQDLNLRKALAYSFPYEDNIQQAWMGESPRAYCPVPPGWLGYRETFNYTLDLDKAEEHFRLAWDGRLWEEGFTIPIVYTAGGTANRIGCELLKASVESINPKFNILITPLDAPVFSAVVWAGQSPLTAMGDWINYPDPHIAYEQQMSSYSLFQRAGHYYNERVDQLISDAFKETDEQVREQMYYEIAEYCYTEVPQIWRTYATDFFVCRSWVKGYFNNPFYSFLWWSWLSK
jgi:peptide/nickel transport system substrate-binding protein